MFFNTNFFKSMFEGQRVLEMKAPNGAVYHYSTNTIDEKTFNDFQHKLEEATKNNDQNAFDQTWMELTGGVRFPSNIETEFKQLQDYVQQLFNRSPFFSNNNIPLLIDPIFSESNSLPEESIDQQIKQYQRKIEELQNKKNNLNTENKKQQIQKEIANKKNSLDIKLDEFAKNLDNEEMKKNLTDEMTKLNEEIKQLENEMRSL